MNKPLSRIIILSLLITALPGCSQKEWWEDCYSSEEEARIDQLEVNLANMEEEKNEKIEELESQLEELESKLSDLQDGIDELQY